MARPLKTFDAGTFEGQVAARIRARRLKLGLGVEDVAAAAGVPRSTWYSFEAGRNLRLRHLPAIAAALGWQPRLVLPG